MEIIDSNCHHQGRIPQMKRLLIVAAVLFLAACASSPVNSILANNGWIENQIAVELLPSTLFESARSYHDRHGAELLLATIPWHHLGQYGVADVLASYMSARSILIEIYNEMEKEGMTDVHVKTSDIFYLDEKGAWPSWSASFSFLNGDLRYQTEIFSYLTMANGWAEEQLTILICPKKIAHRYEGEAERLAAALCMR